MRNRMALAGADVQNAVGIGKGARRFLVWL
jgi:hypothetical protein